MKIHSLSEPITTSSAQAAHKESNQTHARTEKTHAHRHERRKVREYLRQVPTGEPFEE